MITSVSRFRGCLLGLAIGDAIGTTVEFKPRGTFATITGMVGGGPFKLQAGHWTDDTIMALCMAESLIACNGFNGFNIMDSWLAWMTQGYMSPTGKCFDIGSTTSLALLEYSAAGHTPFCGSTHPRASGNGGIMRLAPIVLMYHGGEDESDLLDAAASSSALTHASPECIESAKMLALVIDGCLCGRSKDTIFNSLEEYVWETKVQRIITTARDPEMFLSIKGTGYVVESLEAALWCFFNTHSYEEAVLEAVNLGDDADTTAAICGQVAGAFYGDENIPIEWRVSVYRSLFIQNLADRLYESVPPRWEDYQ